MMMGKEAEKTVYRKLKKVLGDLGFEVIHRVYTLIKGQEVDLLVFHKDLGVWLVSVKAYLNPEKLNSWIGEIYDARNDFLDYLKTLGLREEIWAGALLALPNITKEEYMEKFKCSEKLDHVLILFKEDLTDLDKLRKKFLNGMKKMINIENLNWNEVLAFFGVVPGRISVNPQRYICFLDDVQADIMDKLHGVGFGHKLIMGGAGTGKTWLILNVLKRIEDRVSRNLKVLLMCFNQNLFEFFKKEVAELQLKRLKVDVKRVPLGKGSGFPLAKQSLSEILKRNYDIILCDEVQDYHREAVEFILEKCNSVALFCDDAQRIYVQSRWAWEEIEEKYPLERISLTTVYRSPSPIFKAGVKILQMDRNLKAYYNEYIKILGSSNTVNMWGNLFFVDKIDRDFVKSIRDKFPKHFTSILFPHWGYQERWNDLVPYSDTYLRSKGLEFDIVFLKDFWDFLEKWTMKRTPEFLYTRTYTSITRGRFSVFVEELPSQNYRSEVKRIYEVMKEYGGCNSYLKT